MVEIWYEHLKFFSPPTAKPGMKRPDLIGTGVIGLVISDLFFPLPGAAGEL